MIKIIDNPTPTIMHQQFGRYGFIKIEEIVYISIDENHTELYLIDQSKIISREKLINYYEQLKSYNFHYANRSNIFNQIYLKQLFDDRIQLQNGEELKLSRVMRKGLLKELKK